jgi:hypothetical protein
MITCTNFPNLLKTKTLKKVMIEFSRYPDAEFLQFGHTVTTSLTDNPDFPTTQPTLVVVEASVEAFELALAKAVTGGAADRAFKDQQRDETDVLLRQLAAYVELVSAGNVAKMLSSGFKLNKDSGPIGPLPKPDTFVVTLGGKGELHMRLKAIHGTKLYQYEYKEAGSEEWSVVQSTRSKILITGLPSGKEHVCRVLPIGTSTIRLYSDEMKSFVA